LHKYARSSLSAATITWLTQNRVPGYISGIGRSRCSQAHEQNESSLPGTNPSISVRATAAKTPSNVALAADAEGDVQVVAVSAEEKKEKPKSATPVTLSSEVVPGIFLDRAGCRTYMR